jgi:hypothetical protein
VADDTGTDPEPTGAERYLADRLRDPKYRAAYAAFRSQFPLPDTADDTGTDWAALADVLEDWPYGQPRVTKQEAELAAVGLRRLAQLDTAIGDPGNLRLLADTFDLPRCPAPSATPPLPPTRTGRATARATRTASSSP